MCGNQTRNLVLLTSAWDHLVTWLNHTHVQRPVYFLSFSHYHDTSLSVTALPHQHYWQEYATTLVFFSAMTLLIVSQHHWCSHNPSTSLLMCTTYTRHHMLYKKSSLKPQTYISKQLKTDNTSFICSKGFLPSLKCLFISVPFGYHAKEKNKSGHLNWCIYVMAY